jgi:hypothetical protein
MSGCQPGHISEHASCQPHAGRPCASCCAPSPGTRSTEPCSCTAMFGNARDILNATSLTIGPGEFPDAHQVEQRVRLVPQLREGAADLSGGPKPHARRGCGSRTRSVDPLTIAAWPMAARTRRTAIARPPQPCPGPGPRPRSRRRSPIAGFIHTPAPQVTKSGWSTSRTCSLR